MRKVAITVLLPKSKRKKAKERREGGQSCRGSSFLPTVSGEIREGKEGGGAPRRAGEKTEHADVPLQFP